MLLWQQARSIVIEEVTIVATHSKTRRAVQRLRRLARRRREAELREARRIVGVDKAEDLFVVLHRPNEALLLGVLATQPRKNLRALTALWRILGSI